MDEALSSVSVECGSRLHFGLLAPGPSAEGRSFGGLGLMIDEPRTRVLAGPGQRLEVEGVSAERVARVVAHWTRTTGAPPPPLRIEIDEAADPHQGWGSGTQLALATVAAIEALQGRHVRAASELARLSGRGERSAVGVHGFLHGGLIVEPGRLADEPVAPLAERLTLPEAWRVVLMTPASRELMHGSRERAAFAVLDARAEGVRRQRELAVDRLLPAARAGDFGRFAEALGRFNRHSGEFFAEVQGGVYASPWHRRQVAWLAEQGILGAGQSSWGPTLFALAESEASALSLADRWRRQCDRSAAVRVATPRNRGATVRVASANPSG